ncbi:unnamed protein product [Diamesa serratosioi]
MNHKEDGYRKDNPQRSASRVSRMSFWYLRGLFQMGTSRSITEEDIYENLDEHKYDPLVEKFSVLWEEELKTKDPSVLRMFMKAYGFMTIGLGLLFSVIETVNRCAQPLFLGGLISYFVDDNKDDNKNMAYFYASGIVLSSLIAAITFNPFTLFVAEVALKLKIGSTGLVYLKILKLSKCSMIDGLNGRVINLLSNDLGKFEEALSFLHDLWKGPLETIIVGYLVYNEIGIAGVVGIVFILSFIPIQSWIGKKTANFREKTTKRTDIRVRFMNEIITGIQLIKMYGWEKSFAKLIGKTRRKEIQAVRGNAYIQALLISMWSIARVSIFLTLLAYVYSGNTITARQVFMVTAYYNILNMSMVFSWPMAITFCAEGYVSSKRLKEFLLIRESKPEPLKNVSEEDKNKIANVTDDSNEKKARSTCKRIVHNNPASVGLLSLSNATGAWVSELGLCTTGIESITLTVQPGQLCAVIGCVGSGKTTLLEAVLGEMELDSGTIELHGKLSYANQVPWLFEGSVRSNIIFSEQYDEKRYSEVIKASGLERDFELFEFGDKTIVGERGISLSGGQKARVSLARAVYKKADIYLLDDPLSAVDTLVGKHIFEECIVKFLKNKTVLLVTHQLQYLNKLEHVVLMNCGLIEAQGTFNEISKKDSILHILPTEEAQNTEQDNPKEQDPSMNLFNKENDGPEEEKETQERGTVNFKLYTSYLKSIESLPLVIYVIILKLLSQGVTSYIDYFVAEWVNWEESLSSNETLLSNETISNTPNSVSDERQFYIYTYSALMIVFVLLIFNAEFSFFYAFLRASKNLHDKLFHGVSNTFMSFFNKNSSGRILNRFSNDIGNIDTRLPDVLFGVTTFFLETFGVISLVTIVNPYYMIPTLVMGILLYLLRYIYIQTSRSLIRTESILQSPIYSHTNATLQGLSTIRAFVIIFAFLQFDTSNILAGNVGLAITQVLGLLGFTQWGLRQTAELENQMVSVERVVEYAKLPSEETDVTKIKAPSSWPSKGEIEFIDVQLQYCEDQPPALSELSFKISPMEKIGVVGRTGAGKSSIVQALFLLAPTKGTIKIDGIDTRDLDLKELRSKISIIPQDPILFSGTLRSNLDPFDEKTDENIWNAIEEVELKKSIQLLDGGLHCKINDGGSNFSLGQRQLICLARAILRQNKILILDEATSNVDNETDNLIQKTIRNKFNDCSVLTIAHRLNTIMDSDRIIVMDAGKLVENSHPYDLLQNKKGQFTKLVSQTGPETAGNLLKIATLAKKFD